MIAALLLCILIALLAALIGGGELVLWLAVGFAVVAVGVVGLAALIVDGSRAGWGRE